MKILHFLIIIGIMCASCFVLHDIYAQDCMGGPFCGGNTAFAPTLNRNVTVSLNFHSNYTLPTNVHYLWLRFFDAKTNESIKNVSFFINATKDNKVLMHELFYTRTGFMLMKFHPDSGTGKLIINGTSEPTLGGMMSENDTLPITTSVFATNGTYHIHLEVLTIDYPNNIIDQNNPPTFDSFWLVDEKGNISKYDSRAIGTSIQLENNTVANKIQSPLQQFKSGIAAQDVKCAEGLHLMIKAEDGSPACVETKDATSLFERGWTKQIHYYIDKQASHDVYSYMQPKVTLPDYSYDGMDNGGMVTINNETYYQTTFNYTVDNLPKNAHVRFQNVTFTFPEGILNTPGGSFVPLDVKFTDGFEEVYGGIVKFSDNVTAYSGISIPTMYGPAIARNSVTVIGNHMIPQAGLTLYNDKIMLLVSK